MSKRNNEKAKWNNKSSSSTTKQNQNGRKGLRKVWSGSDKVVPHRSRLTLRWCSVLFYIQETLQSSSDLRVPRWPALPWAGLVEKEKWNLMKKSSVNRNWSILASHIHINTHLRGSTTCEDHWWWSHKNLSVTDKLVPLRRVDAKYLKMRRRWSRRTGMDMNRRPTIPEHSCWLSAIYLCIQFNGVVLIDRRPLWESTDSHSHTLEFQCGI